jgi:hypothetical protein
MQGHRSAPQGAWGDVAPPADLGAGDEPRLPGPDRGGHLRLAGGRHCAVAGVAGVADCGRFGVEGDQADDAAAVCAALAAYLPGGVPWALGTSRASTGRALTGRGRVGRVGRRGPGRPTGLGPTVGGRRRGGVDGCWSCWASVGAGREDAPWGRAAAAAASAATTLGGCSPGVRRLFVGCARREHSARARLAGSPQVMSPPGAESAAKTAADSAPYGEEEAAPSALATPARRLRARLCAGRGRMPWSIQPGCRGPARGSVAAPSGGRRG